MPHDSVPKDNGHIKAIEERIPSLMGWLSECNTFEQLSKACHVGREKNELKIGIIRGHDHAVVDGGLIIDPPPDFPYDDPAAALQWAERHQTDPTPLQILRFDAKLGVTSWKIEQWAPFYIVTVPEFPDFICLVPSTSYLNLYSVHRRTIHTPSSRSRPVHGQHIFTFDDLLAPFAVHQDNIYQALVNIIDASINQTWYTNPTNGVVFHGWSVPRPDTSTLPVLRMHSREQIIAKNAIQKLANFLKDAPEIQLELAMNPVEPLICDLALWDQQSQDWYLVEHKAHTSVKPGSARKEWLDPRLNWHFLIHQSDDHLTIHTRVAERLQDSVQTGPHTLDMKAPSSPQEFASIIRKYGSSAKSRLSNKWKNKRDLYDDSVPKEGSKSTSSKDQPDSGGSARGVPAQIQIQQFGLAFSNKLNNQCWKLGEHGCILLNNHPSADAAIIQHMWTVDEQSDYEMSGVLPVSLVARSTTERKCILLRFIPHHQHPRSPSTSHLFEFSMQTSFELPACSSKEFILVASTGGLWASVEEDIRDLNTLVLLPSSQTTLTSESNACTQCDSQQQQRNWTYAQQSINLMELRDILKSQTAKGARPVSLSQAPFLKSTARPETSIYSLLEGEIHQYFCDLFLNGDSYIVDDIYGPKGLLQRQWNHGESRQTTQRSPEDRLLQRILTTLPPDTQPYSITAFDKDLDEKEEQIVKERVITKKIARAHAMSQLINDSEQGIILNELVALSGFTSKFDLHCDHCPDAKSCRFFRPEIAHVLPKEMKQSCGRCWARGSITCTFSGIPSALYKQLGTFTYFWAHVPCHECWKKGKLCNNSSGSCTECETAELACQREACIRFEEPRGESFCLPRCDKAHCDDGYQNVVQDLREEVGFNAQLILSQTARSPDLRKAVCTPCHERGWDEQCTPDMICRGCNARIHEGESVSCKYMKCYDFATCTRKDCKLAHATQNFEARKLNEWNREVRGKRQDLQVLARRYPFPKEDL